MKTIFGFAALSFFVWSSFGQAAGTTTATTATTTTTSTNKMAQSSMSAKPTDAQIVKIVETANKAEIDAAKIALEHATSTDVKDFAKHMQDEHMSNQDEGMNLAKDEKISPKDFPQAMAMQKQAETKISQLKNASPTQFDKEYIQSQVEMHKQVLNDLNNTLIPAAKDAKLKSFLETTKIHVQQHLNQAEKLQASLK